MIERQKSLSGKIYDPSDETLTKMRQEAHILCQRYNALPETQTKEREEILSKLLGSYGEGTFLQGPIQFDYGKNIYIGKNSYANFNFTVLDVCEVHIGNDVFFGPNCGLYTPLHPLLAEERKCRINARGIQSDLEYGKPITIGDGCWFGANAQVLPGVSIGEGCVIGAGSVVTHSLPPNSLCAGVPCKVLRPLTEKDSLKAHPELF